MPGAHFMAGPGFALGFGRAEGGAVSVGAGGAEGAEGATSVAVTFARDEGAGFTAGGAADSEGAGTGSGSATLAATGLGRRARRVALVARRHQRSEEQGEGASIHRARDLSAVFA